MRDKYKAIAIAYFIRTVLHEEDEKVYRHPAAQKILFAIRRKNKAMSPQVAAIARDITDTTWIKTQEEYAGSPTLISPVFLLLALTSRKTGLYDLMKKEYHLNPKHIEKLFDYVWENEPEETEQNAYKVADSLLQHLDIQLNLKGL